MLNGNPYDILQVRKGAGKDEIDEAYNRLFDSYEPKAQAGDAEAIGALEELNEAHEVLSDPARRAELNASLGYSSTATGPARRVSSGRGETTSARAAGTAVQEKARSTSGRAGTTSNRTAKTTSRGRGSSNAYRPRAVAPTATRSPMPLVFGGVLVVLVVILVAFLVARNSGSGPGVPVATDRGAVVATVSGQPIYESDYQAKAAKDRTNAMSDPLVGSLLAAGGITATRMIDVINQDALDKLINMEVIQQQAKKESLYPSDQEKQDLVTQAKQTDLKGQSLEDFLKANSITAQQYEENVVRNVVYAVVASKHMPDNASEDERNNAFINWICSTRNGYDVKINLTFTVENKPCTSGLPSDIPLGAVNSGGSPATQVPEGVPTTAPLVPQPTPTPKP